MKLKEIDLNLVTNKAICYITITVQTRESELKVVVDLTTLPTNYTINNIISACETILGYPVTI